MQVGKCQVGGEGEGRGGVRVARQTIRVEIVEERVEVCLLRREAELLEALAQLGAGD